MKLKILLSIALIAVIATGCVAPPNGTAIVLQYPDGVAPQVAPVEGVPALPFPSEVFTDTETTRGVGTQTLRALTVINDATVGGVLYGKSSVVFEGATADAHETTFTITDPTGDRTITFPNSSGTVAYSASGESMEFEGATADEFETTFAVVDPTADVTLTFPKETAGVIVSSLTTNATDAANSVTGASNGLRFEGATANDFETTIASTDATADRTITLPDASGTVALTSQAVDMTLTADATGGNGGAKTEFIGLPRVKLVGMAQGTNPGTQTISLFDDTPDGEYAPVDGDTTEALDATYYRYGTKSYKALFAATAAEDDGFTGTNVGAAASWEDMESVGFWIMSSVPLASGDLQLAILDNAPATRKFVIPAVPVADVWTWVEVDISALNAGTGDVISDVAVTLTAQGALALGAFNLYVDQAWVWDSTDEEALGAAVVQDGVLSVVNTEAGTTLTEGTDYIVHWESGPDFIVWVTDQSAADAFALIAY